jgi:hypothetical protein
MLKPGVPFPVSTAALFSGVRERVQSQIKLMVDAWPLARRSSYVPKALFVFTGLTMLVNIVWTAFQTIALMVLHHFFGYFFNVSIWKTACIT